MAVCRDANYAPKTPAAILGIYNSAPEQVPRRFEANPTNPAPLFLLWVYQYASRWGVEFDTTRGYLLGVF